MTSSMSTTLSLVFAVTDIEDSDGLLVYLPSGEPGHVEDDTRDYMAIEMVDRRIRFLWNNGAGKGNIHIHSHKKISGQSRFFEANFDGFWQFSQNVLKIQKLHTPHLKALIYSSLEPEGQGRGLSHMTARTLLLELELFSLKGV